MPYLKMEEEILNSLDIISRMKEPDRSEALKNQHKDLSKQDLKVLQELRKIKSLGRG